MNMKNAVIVLVLLLAFQPLFAQPQTQPLAKAGHSTEHKTAADPGSDVWKKLRGLKYEQVNYVYYPKFNDDIKALDGTKIKIKGFMIPLQETTTTTYFMLSYFPFSNCYFCGQAGPETVMEIKAAKPFTYTEKPITVSGTLKLNRDDEEHLFYILEGTVLSE